MTGLELRLQRTAARVKVIELARAMGVHSSRVSQIEAQAVVTPETADRFEAALGRIALTMSQERAQAS